MNTAVLPLRLDADRGRVWKYPRAGKQVTVWDEVLRTAGIAWPIHRVFRLVEREIDQCGQQLMVPEVELEGWSTRLGAEQRDAQSIIAQYADHGTH